MKRVSLVEARECGYDNAPATVLREETSKVDAAATSPMGKKLLHRIAEMHPLPLPTMRRHLLHNVPSAPRHLSMPITDFGKERHRSGIVFFLAVLLLSTCETREHADTIVATHGGNLLESPIVLPNGCTASRRIESSRTVSRSILLSRLFRRASREFSEQLSWLFYGVANFSKRALFFIQIWTKWSGIKPFDIYEIKQ